MAWSDQRGLNHCLFWTIEAGRVASNYVIRWHVDDVFTAYAGIVLASGSICGATTMVSGPRLDDVIPPLSSDQMRFMEDELVRLNEIAGRSETLAVAGGVFLVWWGGIMAANAFYYDVLAWGWLPSVAPKTLGIIPVVIGAIGSIAIARLRFRERLFVSWRTQSISIIWMFGAIAIFIFMTGSRLAGVANPVTAVAFMAIIFSLITAVMGASDRRNWLLLPAAGWMVCGFAMFFQTNDNMRAGIFGLCSLLCMSIPGLILARQDKRRI